MRKSIPATLFKAQCLALLDRVSRRNETVLITKHGRPVARLVPVEKKATAPLLGCVTIIDDEDDLLSTGVRWETAR